MRYSYDMEEEKSDNKKKKKTAKKRKNKKKVNPIIYKVFVFLLIILTVITISYTIIQEIFSLYTMLPVIIVSIIVILFFTLIMNSKLRPWIKNIFSFFIFIIIILEVLYLIYGTTTLKVLSEMTDTGLRVETYAIYVKNDSKYSKLKDLSNAKITYLYEENDTKNKDLLKKISDEEQVEFDMDSKESLEEALDYVLDGETDAIFLPTSLEDVALEEYNDKYVNLKSIYTYDVVDYVKTEKSDKDITKDTFTVYISGIDTSGKVASKARTDVNIILTINPTTHQILMINTPRDYYVPLATSGKNDKLTHSGIYGIEESVKTLENLYDVDIDYYVRVNFTSFIKIVNALGGITVNVNKAFCEQDSKRDFSNQICLKTGTQKLNGEQALAYARHRKTLAKGDMTRGENQMEILEAIIDKAMTPAILGNYNGLISALSGNVTTNMTSDEMYLFAKNQLSSNHSWNFSSISASGSTINKPCYSLGNARASVVVPDESTVERIKQSIVNIYKDESDIIPPEETTTTTVTTKKTTN